jgi:flavin-dependent dehydrogenase
MSRPYDVAIVGARCAGSVLALKLARAGARVVMIDRDELGSDTLSTHTIFPNTLARLDELGLLEGLLERHELPSLLYRLRVVGFESVGAFTPVGGFDRALAPRRVALDRHLAEAAIEAGAEARFGERVTGLLGSAADGGPVTGVQLASGETISARWTIGADGRASTVARKLGLPAQRPMAGNMAMLIGYWRGLGATDALSLDVEEHAALSRFPNEDGIQLLAVSGPPELTRGGPEARDAAYRAALHEFPTTLDPGELEGAEMITPVRAAPETMLRGFYRTPAGPGWALVGDAGHFKHPGTAQGISDAVEQAVFVADALTSGDGDLSGYEEWRDRRAAGHYEFSFQFGTFPVREVSGPIFAGIAAEPDTAQDLRDAMARTVRPDEVLSPANFERWFQASAA